MVCPLEGPLTLDDAVVRAADRAARIWEASEAGPIVLGSEGHKKAFCRMLLDTHNPYRPSIVDWPILEPEARDRLVSLPIWDIAMQTEGNASLRVLSYAATIKDPLLREAVEIDGFEETRHKQVLSNLVQAYGIPLAPEPEYVCPRRPEWAFLLAGFCECVEHLLRFWSLRAGQAIGIFSARPCQHLRTGGAGGGPAYSIFCQLGGLAPAQSADVATHSLRGQNSFGLGFSYLGEDWFRLQWCPRWTGGDGWRGQQLCLHRRQGDWGRQHVGRRPDWRLPERVRAPLFRL